MQRRSGRYTQICNVCLKSSLQVGWYTTDEAERPMATVVAGHELVSQPTQPPPDFLESNCWTVPINLDSNTSILRTQSERRTLTKRRDCPHPRNSVHCLNALKDQGRSVGSF